MGHPGPRRSLLAAALLVLLGCASIVSAEPVRVLLGTRSSDGRAKQSVAARESAQKRQQGLIFLALLYKAAMAAQAAQMEQERQAAANTSAPCASDGSTGGGISSVTAGGEWTHAHVRSARDHNGGRTLAPWVRARQPCLQALEQLSTRVRTPPISRACTVPAMFLPFVGGMSAAAASPSPAAATATATYAQPTTTVRVPAGNVVVGVAVQRVRPGTAVAVSARPRIVPRPSTMRPVRAPSAAAAGGWALLHCRVQVGGPLCVSWAGARRRGVLAWVG